MPKLSKFGAVALGAFGFSGATGPATINLTVNSTVTNYNIFTSAGSPINASTVNLTITSSGVIGGVAATALTVGQFPTGSIININNSGAIRGFGGAAGTSTVGGNGGDAINANFPNQTVVINNLSGAFIQGGGGGGGKGGAGGVGGNGSFTETVGLGGGYNCPGNPGDGCGVYGAGAFCRSGAYSVFAGCSSGSGKNFNFNNGGGCSDCARNQTVSSTGGAGGAGGNGGIGQGYAQSNASGSTGSAGAAGGTNAGTGGTGGTGGAGAVYGSAGSTGSTGSTGANGNVTNGAAGSAGSAGGAAGRYLVKGSNSVTLNNSGTVAGGLA
jgi:hypothetical protein